MLTANLIVMYARPHGGIEFMSVEMIGNAYAHAHMFLCMALEQSQGEPFVKLVRVSNYISSVETSEWYERNGK